MSIIAVVSGPGLPIDNEAVTAGAFGRVRPSSASTTSIELISASTIRGLGPPDEQAGVVAGRFAPALLAALIFRELNDVFHLRRAGALIIDTEQIAMDRDVRAYPQLQRSLEPVWV
jgi:hypothetical protein